MADLTPKNERNSVNFYKLTNNSSVYSFEDGYSRIIVQFDFPVKSFRAKHGIMFFNPDKTNYSYFFFSMAGDVLFIVL